MGNNTISCGRLASGPTRRAVLGGVAALATAGIGLNSAAFAQSQFPTKPIQVIVPFGPGGLADVTMRIACEEMGKDLGQQFVIENHPGAGGIAAASDVLKSPADGYRLIVLSNGTTIATSLFKKLPYNPQTQFTPISTVAWFDLVLFTNKDSPYGTVKSLLDKAKSDPGTLNIGTVNPGSSQNLAAELFKSVTGMKAAIVTYRTSPDVQTALMRGDIHLAVESYTAFASAIHGKLIRPIAVTGHDRNPALPDVPTVKQLGIENYDVTGWNALYAPAGTPPAVIERLHAAVVKATALPKIKQRFAELGTIARSVTPKEMADVFESDRKKWSEVIDRAGIAKH
jgi:tripartite-type tricarboxylate transporter receptor subunit TctC